jgi:hypothetical protein
MKSKRLLFLYLCFTGILAQAQNLSQVTPNSDSAKQAQNSQSDSSIIKKMDSLKKQLNKATVSINRYQKFFAAGLDPGVSLAMAWDSASRNAEVVEVFNTSLNINPGAKHEAGLQSYVAVRLNKQAPWLRDPRWRSEVCLIINGMPLPEVRPLFFNNDSLFTFYLERGDSSTNQITWDIIQQIVNFKITRGVKLSIGTPLLPALPVRKNNATTFTFIIIYKFGLFAFLGLAAGMSFLLYKFRKSQLFRSAAVDANGTISNGAYSLAKVQLAFWTVIIILCETYIWCITGALPDLSASSLILLGISVGTTALSTAVGYANELKPQTASLGFWRDIISDSAGVPSIHRMQMVIWTLLIGFYFIRQSWLHFAMPDISENMMILMGISSGTYVVFKTQEPKGKPTPASPAAPANPQDVNVNDDEPAAG